MSEIRHEGLVLRTHPDVYVPADDTWLLVSALRLHGGERVLDVGTGTGAVALAAARHGARVTATDVNPAALALAAENARLSGLRLDLVRTDLLRGIRTERYDLVTFNPPYLPTRPDERVSGPLNAAFDGGESGRDLLARWLRDLRIRRRSRALVVVSSLQDRSAVQTLFAEHGFDAEAAAETRFPWEALTIFSLTPTASREASS